MQGSLVAMRRPLVAVRCAVPSACLLLLAASCDSRGGVAPRADADAGSDDRVSLVAQRAACAFGAGARVTDTLPITESERAAIPIKHVIILMKENRSFDHLLGNLTESGQLDAEQIPPSFTNPDKTGALVAPFHLDT